MEIKQITLKTIIITMLIFAIILCGIAIFKSGYSQTTASTTNNKLNKEVMEITVSSARTIAKNVVNETSAFEVKAATAGVSTTSYTIDTSSAEIRLLASIIWAEAGNQCDAGQQAVGIVVMNRVESDLFPNSIYEVLYQKNQFSPARNGSLNKALALYDSDSLPYSCIEAAYYAYSGKKTINYNYITYDLSGYYFFSRKINNPRLIIQDHMFR